MLDTPAIAANELANTRFAYSEPETRALMAYVLARLGPAPAIGPVTLEEMPTSAWLAIREEQPAPAS